MAQRPKLGVDVTRVDTEKQHVLGTRHEENSVEYQYVEAGDTIAAKVPVKIAASYAATASGNAGAIDAVSVVAIASGSFGWVALSGVISAVNVATSITAGGLLAWIADSNGDFQAVSAVAEGGAATLAAGLVAPRAKALANESGGLAAIRLY